MLLYVPNFGTDTAVFELSDIYPNGTGRLKRLQRLRDLEYSWFLEKCIAVEAHTRKMRLTVM